MEQTEYYVVKQRAIPEVLLKVVEAKRLIETERVASVQEAVDRVGISRSSFYKYKEDIFPFHDNSRGQTITLSTRINDRPGLLSEVLQILAKSGVNILTIHQSIPTSGIASLSISLQVLPQSENVSSMIHALEEHEGVHHVTITGRE